MIPIQVDENTFWIEGEVPSSKNNKRWTGKILISSKFTMKWRNNTSVFFLQEKERFRKRIESLSAPLYIEITFVRRTKARFDYINMCQAVFDAMVSHGWIEDDDANNVKPYFGDYIQNKKSPGVYIKVLSERPNHSLPLSELMIQIAAAKKAVDDRDADMATWHLQKAFKLLKPER